MELASQNDAITRVTADNCYLTLQLSTSFLMFYYVRITGDLQSFVVFR